MIVAGIMGANALCDCGFSREDILNIATSMEGHPDNVAPCVLGGLVVGRDNLFTSQAAVEAKHSLAENVNNSLSL